MMNPVAVSRALLLLTFVLSGAPVSMAQVAPGLAVQSPEKADAIRDLLQLSHTAELMRQGLTNGIELQKAANPQIPAVFWTEFLTRADQRMPQYIDTVAVIYDRHFSLAEIKQLTEFYRTPLGQRLLTELPKLVQESTEAGARWGRVIGEEVGRELGEKGVMK